MKANLKHSVRELLTARSLDTQQLRRLTELQHRRARPVPRPRRAAIAVAAGLLLAVLVGVLLWRPLPDMGQVIADEVVLNHLKQRPLEVRGAQVAELRAYFHELGFQLIDSGFGADPDSRLLGGRYCSIQGVTAAQLRLSDRDGRTQTLYQAPYDAELFGPMPDIGLDESPKTLQVRGLTVDLWVEKGLLFARTRE